MVLKRFRPDRSFDGFNVGEVVELDTEDEAAARYIRTGYLEELEDAPVDEPANEPATPDAAAPTNPPAELGQTTVSDSPTDVTETPTTPAAAPVKASRRKAGGTTVEGDGTAGREPGPGDSGQ